MATSDRSESKRRFADDFGEEDVDNVATYQDRMVLKVHCREMTTNVTVGSGEQTFKWLGFVVKYAYASRHPEYDPEQFTCVLIVDKDRRPMFPYTIINESLVDGAEVYVELIGPKIGPNQPGLVRDKTLWELFAFLPATSYVLTSLLFDSEKEEREGHIETIGVIGNFNAWQVPIAMNKVDTHMYKYSLELPKDAEIVFKFVVNDKHTVSDAYPLVKDVNNVEMNYLKIQMPDANFAELQGVDPSGQIDGSERITEHILALQAIAAAKDVRQSGFEVMEEIPFVSTRVSGVFQGVKTLSDQVRRKLFESDWKKMQLVDVAKDEELRQRVKEVLWKHFDEMRNVFRFYSSQYGKEVPHMSSITFVHLLHVCKVPDERLSVGRLLHIFDNITAIEETDGHAGNTQGQAASTSSSSSTNKPQTFSSAVLPLASKANPFQKENQLDRHEFFEALIRASSFKFQPTLDQGLKSMLTEHILPNALNSDEKSIRAQILTPRLQKVVLLYADRLWPAYCKYALGEKRQGRPVTGIKTINKQEFYAFLSDLKVLDVYTLKQWHTVFAKVQEDSKIENKQADAQAAADAQVQDANAYEMVFPEFIEVLSRLADLRYTPPNPIPVKRDPATLDLADKLDLLLMKVFPSEMAAKKAAEAAAAEEKKA